MFILQLALISTTQTFSDITSDLSTVSMIETFNVQEKMLHTNFNYICDLLPKLTSHASSSNGSFITIINKVKLNFWRPLCFYFR